MFLRSGQLQLPGHHRHHQDRAACSLWESQEDVSVRIQTNLNMEETINLLSYHYSSEETDAATAVGMRHHVSITDGQEGDRDHPQGLHVVAAQVPVVVVSVGIKGIIFLCQKI